MSAEPAATPVGRHLKPVEDTPDLIIVNPETGVRVGLLSEYTQRIEDEVAGLQRDIRGWAARFGDLKRDKDAEAEESPVWPAALRVFTHWRRVCRHPRSVFTLDRFELIRPWLEKLGDEKKPPAERLAEAEALCILAVDGINFDPFTTQRKNGTTKRHDGWHLIFDSAERFEERCNAAPIERIREVIGGRTVKQAMVGKRERAQGTLDQPQGAQ